ncbi:Response regulator receiver domain protein (CheY-like) [Desulfatibacillum aliphaticivorans]|uniref:Response regulator receiver domain protein (CheY-like) n=1 Tax=Desulfatibacillum aliphaticivorans TaxID=218208 RepID=B8FKY7_DESAL|nr:response regulator [Desulfatibacillum aliphaticivorans]ACL04622.1 Response regulator receiver domain protein (CheY-like) [Desulfatibacillum aliphaticivorans]
MSTISIFAGAYCQAEDVARKTAENLKYTFVSDKEVIEQAASQFGVPASRFIRTMNGKISVFNSFTHEQERTIAFLKAVVAGLIREQGVVVYGKSAKLIPSHISHVLTVGILGEASFRIKNAVQKEGVSEAQAQKLVHKDAEALTKWCEKIAGAAPWIPDQYDIFLPMDKSSVDEAAALIVKNAKKNVLLPTKESLAALNDFVLAAHVETALVKEGHSVGVEVKDKNVTLTINKHSLMLNKLEDELKSIASNLSGVNSVETKVGPDFYKADIYRKHDFEAPSKVLLVDDEQEFVQTLSDRLLMRDVGSAVVYDGQQALDFIQEDEPEVMVLDLNMPGMDGMEVLRKVKQSHPSIEVIILTGHGSEKDKNLCMDLGAFTYLEKPVDIEVLSEKMREAYKKAQIRK